jgi:hypothetical protein
MSRIEQWEYGGLRYLHKVHNTALQYHTVHNSLYYNTAFPYCVMSGGSAYRIALGQWLHSFYFLATAGMMLNALELSRAYCS